MAASSSHWAVHHLWPLGNQRTELDVVLFHGLQLTANDSSDAWRSTWTQRWRDDVCWPQEWLPFDLREAVRIFSLSYNAHVVTSPYDDVSEMVDNLFRTLIDPRFEWHHPIVLIGHSFGGLVLKSLVVKLKRASTIRNPTNSWSKATVQCAKMFLRNVRGVAFYAVPHAGASNIGQYVNKLLRCNYIYEPWQRDMEQLSVDFDHIVNENKINIYAFCEGRPMEQVGILVDFSSAQRLAGDNSYIVEDADHMEVCKPPSKEHPSYNLLLQFIITCGKECQGVPFALKVQLLDPAMSGAPFSSSTNTDGPYTQTVHPVHELNPRCTQLMHHIMTIIFFHGISFGTNDEWKEAWTSYPTDTRHESVCWPEQWLPEDLGDNVRILSLSYDANVLGAHDHVTEIGKNLIHSLVTSYGNLWVAPIVLVGYSFGGLVVKSLMVEVDRRIHQNSTNALERKVNESCKNFSKYLKGIVFYGVPHSGVSKEFLNYIISKCQEKNVLFEKQSTILNDLGSFNRQMHELSVDFQKSISTDLITFGFAEGKPLDENCGVLVPYASACELTRNNNYKIEDANHLTICKPPAKDHQGYSRLLDVLNTCLEVPGNSTSNGHVVLLAKFKSTMLTNLMPSTFGDTHRSIAIGFKNYTTYNFQNTWVYFENGRSDFNMPFQIGPKHVGIWSARKSNGVPCGSSGTFSYYIKEKNKTLYVMWSVPLNTIAYENLWSATVVDGRQEANNRTHNAMYNGRSGMPRPWTSGGWKHRNINRFRLNGWMSTNRQATLELEVKSL